MPLIGVAVSEGQLAMISEWMDNGNINEFIQKNPDANRIALVCIIYGTNECLTDLPCSWGMLRMA